MANTATYDLISLQPLPSPLTGLIGWLCLKASGTRKLHGIELRSIRCKFLLQVSEQNTTYGSGLLFKTTRKLY